MTQTDEAIRLLLDAAEKRGAECERQSCILAIQNADYLAGSGSEGELIENIVAQATAIIRARTRMTEIELAETARQFDSREVTPTQPGWYPLPPGTKIVLADNLTDKMNKIEAAVLAERQACAKIAEEHDCYSSGGAHGATCQHIIAAEILARGS